MNSSLVNRWYLIDKQMTLDLRPSLHQAPRTAHSLAVSCHHPDSNPRHGHLCSMLHMLQFISLLAAGFGGTVPCRKLWPMFPFLSALSPEATEHDGIHW